MIKKMVYTRALANKLEIERMDQIALDNMTVALADSRHVITAEDIKEGLQFVAHSLLLLVTMAIIPTIALKITFAMAMIVYLARSK